MNFFGLQNRNRLHRRTTGVTLVEVTFALGIFAFAVFPLINIMTVGLSSYRTAMDKVVEVAIVQKIRVMAADMKTDTPSLPESYYRDDGETVESTDPRALYCVKNIKDNVLLKSEDGDEKISRMLVNRYTIIHIPSKLPASHGFVHITPR